MNELIIHYGQDGNRWFAATARAPFFCFEANSKDQALDLAKAALKFYHSVSGEPRAEQRWASVKLQNRVSASELCAA